MRSMIITLLAGLTAGLGTAAVGADEAGLIYGERALALSVDDHCAVLTPGQRAALDAARLQARGTLLRRGTTPAALADYSAELDAQARSTDCTSPEVAGLAARVHDAFDAWLRVRDMAFPGAAFSWQANRAAWPDVTSWSLLQDTGEIRIGLSVRDGRTRFTLALPEPDRRIAAAVLVTRDTDRAARLYDATMDGRYDAPAGADWARWTVPAWARDLVWASDRAEGADTETLSGTPGGAVFHFPDRAARTLAGLDPREAAGIELLDGNGTVIARHWFEVGDFAAALAFLAAGEDDETGS